LPLYDQCYSIDSNYCGVLPHVSDHCISVGEHFCFRSSYGGGTPRRSGFETHSRRPRPRAQHSGRPRIDGGSLAHPERNGPMTITTDLALLEATGQAFVGASRRTPRLRPPSGSGASSGNTRTHAGQVTVRGTCIRRRRGENCGCRENREKKLLHSNLHQVDGVRVSRASWFVLSRASLAESMARSSRFRCEGGHVRPSICEANHRPYCRELIPTPIWAHARPRTDPRGSEAEASEIPPGPGSHARPARRAGLVGVGLLRSAGLPPPLTATPRRRDRSLRRAGDQ
jgi:hypothetical protein